MRSSAAGVAHTLPSQTGGWWVVGGDVGGDVATGDRCWRQGGGNRWWRPSDASVSLPSRLPLPKSNLRSLSINRFACLSIEHLLKHADFFKGNDPLPRILKLHRRRR